MSLIRGVEGPKAVPGETVRASGTHCVVLNLKILAASSGLWIANPQSFMNFNLYYGFYDAPRA